MEGADPIISPSQVQRGWDDRLQTVGLAHYGKSHYAVGTGATGPLTRKGIELLGEFDRLRMILNATHSPDPGFYQALALVNGPVMASHNNCRSPVPGDRQFSDDQIKLLLHRDAVIGVTFDAWMLHPGDVPDQTRRRALPSPSKPLPIRSTTYANWPATRIMSPSEWTSTAVSDQSSVLPGSKPSLICISWSKSFTHAATRRRSSMLFFTAIDQGSFCQ